MIEICGIDMRPRLETEVVEDVLAVVLLSVEGSGSASVIPLVGVEELDGLLAAGELRIVLFKVRERG